MNRKTLIITREFLDMFDRLHLTIEHPSHPDYIEEHDLAYLMDGYV